MAKLKSSGTGLLSQLVKAASGADMTKAGRTPSSVTEGELKRITGFDRHISTGIDFGKSPHQAQPKQSGKAGELSNFVQNTFSGGLQSAASSLLGLGGIGSLISGFESLFGGGGKKTPAPLISFSLPDAENETFTVGFNATSAGQSSSPTVPTYSQSPGASANAGQWLSDHNQQVAQAVKTALLHSHSLSDVISEI